MAVRSARSARLLHFTPRAFRKAPPVSKPAAGAPPRRPSRGPLRVARREAFRERVVIPPHLQAVLGEPVALPVADGKRVLAFLRVLEEENEKRHVLMGLAHERYHPVARPFMVPVPPHRVEQLRSAARAFLRQRQAPSLPLSVWSKKQLQSFVRRGGLPVAVRALETQQEVLGENVRIVRERAAAPAEEAARLARGERRKLSSEEQVEALRELLDAHKRNLELVEKALSAQKGGAERDEARELRDTLSDLRVQAKDLRRELSLVETEAYHSAQAAGELESPVVGAGGVEAPAFHLPLHHVPPQARAAAILVVVGGVLFVLLLLLGR